MKPALLCVYCRIPDEKKLEELSAQYCFQVLEKIECDHIWAFFDKKKAIETNWLTTYTLLFASVKNRSSFAKDNCKADERKSCLTYYWGPGTRSANYPRTWFIGSHPKPTP